MKANALRRKSKARPSSAARAVWSDWEDEIDATRLADKVSKFCNRSDGLVTDKTKFSKSSLAKARGEHLASICLEAKTKAEENMENMHREALKSVLRKRRPVSAIPSTREHNNNNNNTVNSIGSQKPPTIRTATRPDTAGQLRGRAVAEPRITDMQLGLGIVKTLAIPGNYINSGCVRYSLTGQSNAFLVQPVVT